MRARHEIEIECACPSDDLPDVYRMTVKCERTIKVEDIITAADQARSMKVYQEDLALWFARKLNAQITLEGVHYGRVKTTVSAP